MMWNIFVLVGVKVTQCQRNIITEKKVNLNYVENLSKSKDSEFIIDKKVWNNNTETKKIIVRVMFIST